MRKMLLLSDDTYLGKMAINEEVEYVFDLVTFLEALLKKRDFYVFSEDDRRELFSYFE